MGATLFYRSTRRLTLTDAGQAFHQSSKQVLLDLEEARVRAAGLQDHPSGTLRLTVSASFGPFVIGALRAYRDRWPDVHIIANVTDRMVDLVAEGQDLAIRIGRLADSPLCARLIGRADRLVCASPGYVEAHGAPVMPDDLAGHDCLVFRASPGHNVWRFRQGRRRWDVKASGHFIGDDGPLLVQAARQGMGIVLAPRWLLGADLAAGRLVPLLTGYAPDPSETPVYAVHAYARFVPPKVRTFIDHLARRFQDERTWAQAG